MPPQEAPRALVEASLDIGASPPVLWATFSDLSRWPRWETSYHSGRWVEGLEWTLHSRLELAMDLPFPARSWAGVAAIVEVQPGVSVAWETEYPLGVTVVRSYRFKPCEIGTLLQIREAYYSSAVLLYRLSRFPSHMGQSFRLSLQKLKTYLEG